MGPAGEAGRLAAERDCAVLIATSEFEELLGLADEIHVMRSGRISKTLTRSEASYKGILEHALHWRQQSEKPDRDGMAARHRPSMSRS